MPESGTLRCAPDGRRSSGARNSGATGSSQRSGLGSARQIQAAASRHQSPGSGDPETSCLRGSLSSSGRRRSTCVRSGRCQPQPLGQQASNVRWRARNNPCVRQSPLKPRILRCRHVPKPVRSGRIDAPRVNEPMRPEGPGAPRPPQGRDDRYSQGWSHPQAKPAPPVQQRNPAQARDDENKFRNWQQQRQQAAPPQNRAPQVAAASATPAAGKPAAKSEPEIGDSSPELPVPISGNWQFFCCQIASR